MDDLFPLKSTDAKKFNRLLDKFKAKKSRIEEKDERDYLFYVNKLYRIQYVGDTIYNIIELILSGSTLPRYLERCHPGTYFYYDNPMLEVKNENPINNIDDAITKIILYKNKIFDDVDKVIGNFKVYREKYNEPQLLRIFTSESSFKLDFIKEGCQINFTLPHMSTSLKVSEYAKEVEKKHINLIKALQLIYPLILTVFNIPSIEPLPRGNTSCSHLACPFTCININEFYNTISAGSSTEVRHIPKYNDFQIDFFTILNKKLGTNTSDRLGVGKDFRLNMYFHDISKGLFFGFEFRLALFVPHLNYILRIICLLAEYLETHNINIENNIIDNVYMNKDRIENDSSKGYHYKYSAQFVLFALLGWLAPVRDYYISDIMNILKININYNPTSNAYDILNNIYNFLVTQFVNTKLIDTKYLKYFETTEIALENLPNVNLIYRNIMIDKTYSIPILPIFRELDRIITSNPSYKAQQITYKAALINGITKSGNLRFGQITLKNDIYIAEDIYYYLLINGYISS